MISRITKSFRIAFKELPEPVKKTAREVFKHWQQNNHHPSLRFKQIHIHKPIYSVRIGKGWRALGVKSDECIIWFWIGSHSDYDKLISQL